MIVRDEVPGELLAIPGEKPELGVVLRGVQMLRWRKSSYVSSPSPQWSAKASTWALEDLARLLRLEAANANAFDLPGPRRPRPSKSTRRSSKRRTSR